jgi:hypothetical protein
MYFLLLELDQLFDKPLLLSPVIRFKDNGQKNTENRLSVQGLHIQAPAHVFDQPGRNVKAPASGIRAEKPLFFAFPS